MQLVTKNTISEIRQKDLESIERLILFFYPKDNTPGCSLEAKDFSNLSDEFSKLGYKVFGVNNQTTLEHKKFIESCDLNIGLISNGDELLEKYKIFGTKNMYGKEFFGIIRTTIVFEKGNIIKRYDNVKATGHAFRILNDLGAK